MAKWKFWMDLGVYSSPAIDNNGTIYIGTKEHDVSLFALNPDGSEKWHFNVGAWVDSSPAIAADGTIYFGCMNGNLYAINPNGTEKWRVNLGEGWVFSSPVIDANDTIYAASVNSKRLCAIFPNGTIKWSFYADNLMYCSPAIGQDGTIYVGSNDGYMYAVYSNGMLKWKYYAGGPKGTGSPSISDEGMIYFGCTSGAFYALYPNGSLRWKIDMGYIGDSSPAIGADGTIYIGDHDNWIYSINPNGSVHWRFQTDGEMWGNPSVDKYGVIYCGSMDGYLYALNPDGTLRWKFFAGDEGIESSPVVGEDGTIYITGKFQPSGGNGSYSYLYALDVIENDRPNKPTVNGPASGRAGQSYDYTFVTTDPEESNVSYYIEWGDNSNSGWIGPYASGEEITQSHTWSNRGIYIIQAKAKDVYNAESDWGTLSVTMPLDLQISKSNNLQINQQSPKACFLSSLFKTRVFFQE